MTTTPSTASQAPAVSIDDPELEFRNLLAEYATSTFTGFNQSKKFAAVVNFIDAKLAQEREEAIGALAIAFEKMLCAAVGRDWSTSGISASSLVEELRSRTEKAESRATAAEAKLEAIRQGVRECVGMGFDKNGPNWISRQQVLSLFQQQPQADESGLPG